MSGADCSSVRLVSFVLVLLLPGAIQRYVMPLLIPACCLLGLAVKSDAFEWKIPRPIVISVRC